MYKNKQISVVTVRDRDEQSYMYYGGGDNRPLLMWVETIFGGGGDRPLLMWSELNFGGDEHNNTLLLQWSEVQWWRREPMVMETSRAISDSDIERKTNLSGGSDTLMSREANRASYGGDIG